MKYLVQGNMKSAFTSPEDLVRHLEEDVMPSFEYFKKLEKEKKILAGGLVAGERAFVFIAEAASNEEIAQIVREIPLWPMMDCKITALEPVADRAKLEQKFLQEHLATSRR
jgi:hypothetical protein